MLTNPQAIAQLTSVKGNNDNISGALDAALKILTTGYQSDQVANHAAIADGIAKGVAQAVQAATDPLQAQIQTLTENKDTLSKQVDDLTAQVASLTPVPVDTASVDATLVDPAQDTTVTSE